MLASVHILSESPRYPGIPRQPLPVFDESSLQVLALQIAQALAQASRRQDVSFAVSSRGIPGSVDIRLTSARVFYREGKLNLIFGHLLDDTTDLNASRVSLSPGSRSEPSEHQWVLASGPGLDFFTDYGVRRSDWIVVRPDVRLDQIVRADTGMSTSGPAVSEEAGLLYHGARDQMSDAVDTSAGPAVPVVSGEVAALPSESALEQRLRDLKALREQGLITENAYRARMEEILKEL
jgi:hypothetical protein